MKDTLEIKWPWTMISIEHVNEIISWIKEVLPPDHELQTHDIFPGIKWDSTENKCLEDLVTK